MKILSVSATVALALLLMSASYESTTQGRIASKKSGCQTGMGICILKDSPRMCYPIQFHFETTTSLLTLRIQERELQKVQPQLYAELKGQTAFQLEEDLVLPEDLVQSLHLTRSLIVRGSYRLTYAEGNLIIDFRL